MNDFWSKFKWYLAGGGFLLFVGAIVLVVVLINSSDEGPTVAAPSPGAGPDGSPPPRIEKVPGQELEGTGNKQHSFKAGGGLTVFTLTHDGNRNFVVQYGQGGDLNLLVNQIGPFQGSKAVGLPVGDYVLDIATTGKWTVTIDQSVPTEANAPPKKLEGDGVEASEFFALKPGPARFSLTHEANGFFAPQLIKAADGTVLTNLANELGRFTGDKTVEIHEEGIYLVDVTAAGKWTIEVAQ
jgi:hypothetical protein